MKDKYKDIYNAAIGTIWILAMMAAIDILHQCS